MKVHKVKIYKVSKTTVKILKTYGHQIKLISCVKKHMRLWRYAIVYYEFDLVRRYNKFSTLS